MLDQVRWDPVAAWGFPWGQAVDGLVKFLYGRFNVELFDGRQALDGIESCSRHDVLSNTLDNTRQSILVNVTATIVYRDTQNPILVENDLESGTVYANVQLKKPSGL